MLYLIGLGLWDEHDLSSRGIEAARSCDYVYMETYTASDSQNRWQGSIEKLQEIIGKQILLLSREQVESEELVEEARTKNVALLIPGDPLAATTHFQLFYECRKNGIECHVIHASSIYAAVALTGLQLYKFGRATTIPKPQKGYVPQSPYDVIAENKKAGLHTLVFLDTAEGGMSIKEGIEALKQLDTEKILEEKIVVAARLGSKDPVIKYGYSDELMLDEKPAVIIIPGALNFKEEEALKLWE